MRLFSRALVLAVLLACSTPTVWAAGEDETKDNDGGEVKRGDDDVANVDVDEKQAEGPPVEEKSSEDRGRKVQPAPVVPESPTGHLDGLAKKLKVHEVDVSFYHGFFASLSVIIVSELGDKTWFIAVIMSMKHSRLTVFSGAIAALALMTVLSACLGWVTQLIPRVVTYYLSTALFALFGLKMLHEGWYMNPEEGQEVLKEAGEEVQKHELEREGPKYADLESGVKGDTSAADLRGLHAGLCYSNPWVIFSFISAIFVEAFTLTFIAEWGDRSQLTTIILAAREDIAGVIIGGVLGHALCTGIAVIGGKIVAQRISVRNVTLIGGVVFILFALSAFFINQPEPEPIVMDV